MLSVLRRTAVVAGLVALSAGAVEAQFGNLKVSEIRLDVASLTASDGNTAFALGGPTAAISPVSSGGVAVGIYLNDKLAFEPRLAYGRVSETNFAAFGLYAPYYLAGDAGRSGFFVAPGLEISKAGANDAAIDFGADFGIKRPMSDKVSWRAAGLVRAGDSNDELLVGATFGFSIFFR